MTTAIRGHAALDTQKRAGQGVADDTLYESRGMHMFGGGKQPTRTLFKRVETPQASYGSYPTYYERLLGGRGGSRSMQIEGKKMYPKSNKNTHKVTHPDIFILITIHDA